MEEALQLKPKRRGKPKRRPFDPALLRGWNMNPSDAAGWFTVGDHVAWLRSQGYAAEDIAFHLGVSPATVSRWVRGARWPKNIRARILLGPVNPDTKKPVFTVRVLMNLARTIFKDQGSQTAKDGRKGPKSHLTLLGAVLRLIEGKALPKTREKALARADRLERALIDERGRRQAMTEECKKLREEKEALEAQLSADVLSDTLRRNHELESEVQRLRLVPGAATHRPKKSNDLQRVDDDFGSVLGVRLDTLDWAKGLLLIKAGSGDILDGVRERITHALLKR